MADIEYENVLRSTMMKLTDTASQPVSIGLTLRDATQACVDMIDGCVTADVLTITEGVDYESTAATSALSETLNRAQQQFGEGPCVKAATGDPLVRADDLATDPRWPRFAAAAVAAGVRSTLSFQLFSHDSRVCALNIHGADAGCFGEEAEALGAMLATHCAIALIADNKEHEFRSALASRDVIGQAKGRIMERFDVDAVHAFDLLRSLSQNSNTRISDIAVKIASGGVDRRLPENGEEPVRP